MSLLQSVPYFRAIISCIDKEYLSFVSFDICTKSRVLYNELDPERIDRRPFFRFHLFCKSAKNSPILYYPFHLLLYPYNSNDTFCIVKLIPNNGSVDYFYLNVDYIINQNSVGYEVKNLIVTTPLLQRWKNPECVCSDPIIVLSNLQQRDLKALFLEMTNLFNKSNPYIYMNSMCIKFLIYAFVILQTDII